MPGKSELLYTATRNPAIAVGIPILLGPLSGLVTKSSIETWYEHLKAPALKPPRYAFPIAWGYLYPAMGLASHLLVLARDAAAPGSEREELAGACVALYFAQLALNLAWTPLFFGAKNMTASLIDISILTPLTYILAAASYKVDKRTLLAFGPYVAWLSFATYLNAGYWWHNAPVAQKLKRAFSSDNDGAEGAAKDVKGKGKAE